MSHLPSEEQISTPPSTTSVSPPASASTSPSPPSSPTSAMGTSSAKGKRRSATPNPRPDLEHHLIPPPPKISTHSHSFFSLLSANRRKRFLVYTIAFATMLALSSILDDRRALFKQRHSKVQLVLPSGSSLSSIADSDKTKDSSHPPLTDPAQSHPSHQHNTFPITPSKLTIDSKQPLQSDNLSDVSLPPTEELPLKVTDVNLSEQELKDDVDQLIAHVDQEASIDANAVATNTSATSTNTTQSSPHQNSATALNHPPSNQHDTATTALTSLEPSSPKHSSSSPTANSTLPDSEVRLNSEEHFNSAQKRLEQLLADEASKKLIDETDLLTLHALSLQATRGDCEQKSASEGGSLFKTDAEAASNLDIERTDPLWGAWCLFMGSYKTDAMRDYVLKQHVVENKVLTVMNEDRNTTIPHFDSNAASLDDVMTPEEQSALRLQTDTILAHLQDSDVRYLAALSLQATYGDCGPYARELEVNTKDLADGSLLRKLVDPLLGQIVKRREGAQWGAWCVMQGKKRILAASDLTQRVSLLVDQLSKSQAADDSRSAAPRENPSSSTSSDIISAGRTSSRMEVTSSA